MSMNSKQEIRIKSERQKNGLYGFPSNLGYIENMEWENAELRSAIVMAISETYPDETFGIYNVSSKGFHIKLSKSGWKRINYENYSLNGNILTYNEVTGTGRV